MVHDFQKFLFTKNVTHFKHSFKIDFKLAQLQSEFEYKWRSYYYKQKENDKCCIMPINVIYTTTITIPSLQKKNDQAKNLMDNYTLRKNFSKP